MLTHYKPCVPYYYYDTVLYNDTVLYLTASDLYATLYLELISFAIGDF